MSTRLRRTTETPTPPIRLIHLGLGAFHRAHQVWYTQHSEADPLNPQWGYASFTGRSRRLSDALTPQKGVYTLLTRSAEGDTVEHITSLVEVQPANNLHRFLELMVAEQTAVVTLTVTEAGYHLTANGQLDISDGDVAHDIAALRSTEQPRELRTAAGKIVAGLRLRRASGRGLAVMSCDNVASNGSATHTSVVNMAHEVDTNLAHWINTFCTFPSTSIDRITPATDDAVRTQVDTLTGYHDEAPVVTEPFANWIIQGDFPAGRPDWERGGAQIVENIDPFERRKLWMLNGSHSLMAYLGQLRGHSTVAEAIVDNEVRYQVEHLWDAVAAHLTEPGLELPAYRASLVTRFSNPRIEHRLAQIAIDNATKLRMRVVPVVTAGSLDACAPIAAWIAWLECGGTYTDTRADEIDRALQQQDTTEALVKVLSDHLDSALPTIRSLVERFKAQRAALLLRRPPQ